MTDDELDARLLAALAEELPGAVELRHRLHEQPRAFGDESETADTVVAALLRGSGPESAIALPVAQTGRVVALHGSGGRADAAGPAIALRAELDALPLVERTGVPWTSRTDHMHACGHDVHLAAVVVAARAIGRCAGPRRVAVLLQPREEGEPSGALDVVRSGALDELAVGAVIGAHVQPRVPTGVLAVTAGLVNASVDEFRITVTGHVGHVGYPHHVADPVVALAAVVVALQQIPARRIDPVAGAVCVVTEMHAGNAINIIPGEAWARGSLRLMRDADREAMRTTLTEIAECTARAHGCAAQVDIVQGEPSLLNDPVLASGTAARLTAWGRAVSTEFRSFGADDFSWYGRTRPSLMVFVGVEGPGLHDPTFLPPDESVRTVAEALLAGYLAAVDQVG